MRARSRCVLSVHLAAAKRELPRLHKDPSDRMLVAQASVEPMILLTNDEALRGYGAIVTVAL
jgi:PIN domain nuclease of toxin-antitoxin system